MAVRRPAGGELGGGFYEKGGRVLSHSTIRAQGPHGLESVGEAHSEGRGHRSALGRLGLSVPVALIPYGQLALVFSLHLDQKIGRFEA